MTMRLLPTLVLTAFAGTALAKLPPPDDATKAKQAEATAKAAWQAKVEAYQLCRAQDRIAAKFGDKGNGGAKAQAGAAKPAASGAAPAAAPVAAASAPAAAASGATGTPVTSAAPPPCADPGPFAYTPPQEKPLETSGAHSPAGTAAGPPSVRQESGTMTPAK